MELGAELKRFKFWCCFQWQLWKVFRSLGILHANGHRNGSHAVENMDDNPANTAKTLQNDSSHWSQSPESIWGFRNR